MSADHATRLLDLRGLRCPLPALKTKRALARSSDGATLIVLSDDPLARLDVPNAVREAGGDVISTEADGPAVRFVIVSGR